MKNQSNYISVTGLITKTIIWITLTGWPLSEIKAQYTSEESQKPKKENPLSELSFKDRLYYGGNLGLGIQQSWFYLNLAPAIGYKITPKYSVGIGAKYMTVSNKQQNYSLGIYGSKIFTRYYLLPALFLHSEIEGLRLFEKIYGTTYYSPKWAMMMLSGAGLVKDLGAAQLQISLLYDFINSPYSPYRNFYLTGNPNFPLIYQIGFMFGF